jgi:hypothetical protein
VTAFLRCCCLRCAGGVTYTSPVDWLTEHQLSPGEIVLESEVRLAVRRDRPTNAHQFQPFDGIGNEPLS